MYTQAVGHLATWGKISILIVADPPRKTPNRLITTANTSVTHSLYAHGVSKDSIVWELFVFYS